MLEGFKNIARELFSSIHRLSGVAVDLGHEKIVENLSEIEEKLSKSRFHLVVLGQFKRGKSTFINSLLAQRVLPTAVVPLTSIVTLLKYGSKESVEVVFENGRVKRISNDELADYVTERGNPENEKGVAHVEVAYPSPYLKDGVFIIDTPGVGSTFENNTAMTYNYLPKVDAAIFMLAVDPPMSRSEISFLRDVKEHVEKIFFVQNKIDYLTKEEQEESLEFSRQVISGVTGSEATRIYPLSAKMALDAQIEGDEEKLAKSRIREFDSALGAFLSREKGRTVLRSTLTRTLKLLADVEFGIELERRALNTPLEALTEKIVLFENEMAKIKEERRDSGYLFEGEVKRLLDMLDLDIARMKRETEASLINEVEELALGKRHLGAGELHSRLKKMTHARLVALFDEWIPRQEKRLNEEYARISRRFSDRTNGTIDTILDLSQELFDIELERFSSEESIAHESGFYYLLGDTPRFFDVEKAGKFLARSIMPSSTSRARVLKEMKRDTADKVDMHSGRVRHDFSERLKKSFLKFRWDLNLKVDATEEGIRSAIEKAMALKKASKKEVDKETGLLAGFSNTLNTLKREFERAGESISKL